jgi:hypothetical protein
MSEEPIPKLKRQIVTMTIYCGYADKGHAVKHKIQKMAEKARRSLSDFVMNVLEDYKG